MQGKRIEPRGRSRETGDRPKEALERLEELLSRFLVELDETLSSVEARAPEAETGASSSPGSVATGLRGLRERVSEVREPVAEPWGPPASGGVPPMDAMIDALTPRSVPTAPAVLQARRNSAARAALIEEFGLLTSAEVAELNRSEAENRSALASRWKREGRIFSVKHHGRDYFPGFQFRSDGPPRAAIAEVLKALAGAEGGPGDRARGWETALWLTGANGYLGGRRPVDLLEIDPDAVVEAAEHEAAEIYF